MKSKWLNKNGHAACILFFNGWGMDEQVVRHLTLKDRDLVMLYQYDNSFQIEEELSRYDSVDIVAWSFGVFVATRWAKAIAVLPNIETCTALNGTIYPSSATKGIPPKLIQATYKGWSIAHRKKFLARIGVEAYAEVSQQEIDRQQKELEMLYILSSDIDSTPLIWTAALIGQKDYIFLPQNQENGWYAKAKTYVIPTPHNPFPFFSSWEQIYQIDTLASLPHDTKP